MKKTHITVDLWGVSLRVKGMVLIAVITADRSGWDKKKKERKKGKTGVIYDSTCGGTEYKRGRVTACRLRFIGVLVVDLLLLGGSRMGLMGSDVQGGHLV